MKTYITAFLGFAFTLLITQPVSAEDALNNDWQLSGAIYFWLPDIKGETDGDDVKITLNNILKHLDFMYMGAFGAKKGNWSFLTDVIYMDLEDGSDMTLIRDKVIQLDVTKIQLQAWVATPMVAYDVLHTDRLDVKLLLGARYLWLEGDLDLKAQGASINQKTSETFSNHAWNGIIGTRGQYELNEKWTMPFHFDVGSGDSDKTWQAYIGLMYKTGKWEIGGGYRYLKWDFDDDDAFGKAFKNLSINGPMFGAKYRF
ncbi:MAG: hypothetical protein QNK19_09500 [Xanthomonadales bacterium]|nr:hypothetical protein [Xanthomonadales bacterium]